MRWCRLHAAPRCPRPVPRERHLQRANSLARTLLEGGASPNEVILEITESAAARNQGAALENLARMRRRGLELSIDDFGTGYFLTRPAGAYAVLRTQD